MFSWLLASKVDINLWSDLGANLDPFWEQKSTKIESNIDLMSKSPESWKLRFPSYNFYQFGGPGGSNIGRKLTNNGSKKCFENGLHLGINFWQVLVEFWTQVGKENRSKIAPKRHRHFDQISERFLDHFGSILGAKLGPCWRLKSTRNRPKNHPRRAQEPEGAQKPPRSPKWPRNYAPDPIRWSTFGCLPSLLVDV